MCIVNDTKNPIIEMCCEYGESSTLFVVTEFPSRKYVVSQAIYCVASGTLIIPTVILNGISVLTIWKNSHLKAKLCYFLILVQSIFDIAVGVISVLTNIAVAALELRGIASCLDIVVLEAIAFIPAGVSLWTICLLTFERYMSILHPIFHRSHVTKARMLACACCAVVWVTVTGPVIKLLSEKLHTAVNGVIISFFFLFNTFVYTRIYFAVKKMRFSNDGIGDYSAEQKSFNIAEKRKSLRERNLAKSCGLVVLLCYLCYMPFTVCYLYFRNDQINFRVAYCWCGILISLNSSLNSLVFFWKRPSLRQEALSVLKIYRESGKLHLDNVNYNVHLNVQRCISRVEKKPEETFHKNRGLVFLCIIPLVSKIGGLLDKTAECTRI